MSLTVSDFRTVGTSLGNTAIRTDQQQSAFVQGEKGAWIKSLLNIGGAREANARTIDALRQAVHNDPQYAKVTEWADAILGRVSASTPLTGRQINGLLGQLDTAVAAAAKADARMMGDKKGLISNIVMRETSRLEDYAGRVLGLTSFKMAPADKASLNSLILDRIKGRTDGFKQADERDIRTVVQNAAGNFALLQDRLDKADLPRNIKNIIKEDFFQGAKLMNPKQLEERIQTHLNIQANEKLRATMSDVSNPENPLRTVLAGAMTRAGITAPMNDIAMAGLAKAIASDIDKAGDMGKREVTFGAAGVMIGARVNTFVEAYLAAGAVVNPGEAAFLQNLALNSPNPVTPDYVRALSGHAGNLPPEAFTALGNATNPKQFMDAIENLGNFLFKGFALLDPSLKQEGGAGRNYMGDCLSLGMLNAGINTREAREIFANLDTSLGQEMRAMIAFSAATDPGMANRNLIVSRFMESLAQAGGIDLDEFMAKEAALRPTPRYADAFSLDVRALLPGHQPLQENIRVTKSPDLAMAREMGGRQLANDMSIFILLEMQRQMSGAGGSAFARDITSHGPQVPRITVGGTTLPHAGDIPEESLLRPGEEAGLDPGTLAVRRQQAAMATAYNGFAQIVTGSNNAVFSQLSPADRIKTMVLACLSSREMESAAVLRGTQSIAPDFGPSMARNSAFTLGTLEDKANRTIDIQKKPNGDFVIRVTSTIPAHSALIGNRPVIKLDETRSSQSAVSTLTISRAEMDRLSLLIWNPASGELTPNHVPRFSGYSVAGELSLFHAPEGAPEN
ncbi:MAG: hypothetical protein FWF99_01960 [Desulfovibrionaceae bacterium]|nr:hypothetical protein [Desulfovibrionaceae bacterium]